MRLLRTSAVLLTFTGVSILAACGGGGGGGSSTVPNPGGGNPGPTPVSSSTPTPTTTSSPSGATTIASNSTIDYATNGASNGTLGKLGADTGVTTNAVIDGVPCGLSSDSQADPTHHIHVFLGVVVNGTQYGIPEAVGIFQPTAAANGYVSGGTCLFYLHTHDHSGTIHIEPAVGASDTYTLGEFSQIWGQTISTGQVGPFTGAVSVYIGTPPSGSQTVTSYTLTPGDPNSLVFSSHQAIWLIVGTPPSTLPKVAFGTEQ
jgi:hypothetical protein